MTLKRAEKKKIEIVDVHDTVAGKAAGERMTRVLTHITIHTHAPRDTAAGCYRPPSLPPLSSKKDNANGNSNHH